VEGCYAKRVRLTSVTHRSLWVSFEEEIAMFFCAWHFPTLKEEYRNFFRISASDKMTTPLGNLSVYLMISALGIMMRASQKEIFGQAPQGSANLRREEVDLTCSRLQSELYRAYSHFVSQIEHQMTLRFSHSIGRLPSSPSLLLPLFAYPLHPHCSGPHRDIPTQFRTSKRLLVLTRQSDSPDNRHRSAHRSAAYLPANLAT
jgi:hypothetical protein